MGYMHIENLYRPTAKRILEFSRVYALEKIHGTSAHVTVGPMTKEGKWQIRRHHGGSTAEAFLPTTPTDEKLAEAASLNLTPNGGIVTFYGEAYGGKIQRMQKTYGEQQRFVVFDVRLGENYWMRVPSAHSISSDFGFEFVDYALVSSDMETLDALRDRPSVQGVRNGIERPGLSEGIVIRPPFECMVDGSRLIAKHKGEAFRERKHVPKPTEDPAVFSRVNDVVSEWVTEMRLSHVIDKVGGATEHKDIPKVIGGMIEDVFREASGEFDVDERALKTAIGKATANMFKRRLENDDA